MRSWKQKNGAFVVTMAEPNSMAGEAYRSLRTSLQFAALETKARVILVTSPGEAEGKSSTVANLGVVLAKAGERVAIVSCDLRHPRVGQFFGLDERVGLTTVLLGRHSLTEALRTVPAVDGLSILTAGVRPTDPTAVLSNDRLAEVFDQLRQTFDVVLVDSPPVLLFTDAAILAQVVDVTLLVVASGRTLRKDLRRATEVLSLVRASIVGVALNEVPSPSGYRHGDADGKRYGHSKRKGYSEPKQYGEHAGANGNGNGQRQRTDHIGIYTCNSRAGDSHRTRRTPTGCRRERERTREGVRERDDRRHADELKQSIDEPRHDHRWGKRDRGSMRRNEIRRRNEVQQNQDDKWGQHLAFGGDRADPDGGHRPILTPVVTSPSWWSGHPSHSIARAAPSFC